jgi:hypothetical protein
MVQLRLLSGSQANRLFVTRHFPCRIGRSGSADLQLEEEGIWDQHLEIWLRPQAGLVLALQPGALGTVNGQPFQTQVLHNGDLIEVGAVKLQFWLSETRFSNWLWREGLTWFFLGLLCLVEVGLVYWLSAIQ